MEACPKCGAALETPLACTSCGELLAPPDGGAFEALGPFALLGLPVDHVVDGDELKKRLLRLSRSLHPDFFAMAAEDVRRRAEENSAALNWAHEILADEVRRADWLVAHLGGPSEAEERQMPQEFLLEVLDWNERLEAARESGPGSPPRAGLPAFAESLSAQRAECLAALRAILDPPPEPGAASLREARRRLNAVRYLDRALREIESLRLEEAASR